MGWVNEEKKEFICKQCGFFLNTIDLKDGKCPNCNTDEDLFVNDRNED